MHTSKTDFCLRDERLDFLRCILMLGICILHSLNQYDAEHWRYGSMWYWCVDGFVFISGWFGCKFRPSKIIRLCCIALWCAIVIAVVDGVLTSRPGGMVAQTIRCYKDAWFLHAYVFMTLLAPFVDCAIDSAFAKGWRFVATVSMPFLLLVFGWSYLANWQAKVMFLPTTSGMGASTGLTLIGIYAIARVCRKSGVLEKFRISTPYILLLFGVVFGSGISGLNLFNSPMAIIMTVCIFTVVLRLPRKILLGRVWAFLAPSMFSVYLLHTNYLMFSHITSMVDSIVNFGVARFLAFFVLAICMFIGCTLADFGRRVFSWLINPFAYKCLVNVDTIYDRAVDFVFDSARQRLS